MQGESHPCYTGPAGTEGHGICQGGTATCLANGTGFGPCTGEIRPDPNGEDCNKLGDEDCDGVACSDPVDVNVFDNATFVGIQDIAIDAQHNTYAVGRFTGSATFGSQNLISAGAGDYFVVKFDSTGAASWAKSFGDASDNGSIIRVALDAAGNPVIAGELKGTVGFGGGPLTSAGAEDVFVVKLDPSGNFKWGKRFGDASSQRARAVKVDSQGDVIIAGEFAGTTDFGGGALTAASNQPDAFLCKLAGANGAHLWSKRFAEISGKPASIQDISALGVDAGGNIVAGGIVVASTMNSIDLGGTPFTSGTSMLFVARYDGAGNHSWSQAFSVSTGGGGSVRDLAIDALGAATIVGDLTGTVDFGGGALTGSQSNFVVKFNAAGAHQWSRAFSGTTGLIGSVATDSNKNIIMTGAGAAGVDFGGGPLNAPGPGEFLVKLGPGGNHLWSKLFSGAASQVDGVVAIHPGTDTIALAISQGQGTVDYGTGPKTCSAGMGCTVLATFQP